MIRARRWQALSLAPICATVLLSLHACDRLFPEQPLAAAVTPSEPVAAPDHGDTRETATSIRQGSPLAGEFRTDSDVDYFKVEVTTEHLLYVSTDQGNPRHAPTIVSVEGPHGAWSSHAQDQLVNDLVPGTYYIKVERDAAAAPAGEGYDLAVWLFGQENETFDIQLRYLGTAPTDAQKRVFEEAASFWEGALKENARTIPAPLKSSRDRCPDTPSHFGELVDDLLINIQLDDLDGPQHTLALGGYCIHRLREGQPDLPVIAIMVFDTGDIGRLEADESLLDLAIHEMAHALGFGMDLWRDRGYLHNPTIRVPGGAPADPPPDTYFSGARARQEFDAAGGTSYAGAKVPVENDTVDREYGEGSLDSHWRESVFGDELMTATVGRTAFVSRVTLGSLEDLGYAVNYDAADPFLLPGPSTRASLRAASGDVPPGSSTPVADDIYREPPRALDLSVELVEVLGSR